MDCKCDSDANERSARACAVSEFMDADGVRWLSSEHMPHRERPALLEQPSWKTLAAHFLTRDEMRLRGTPDFPLCPHALSPLPTLTLVTRATKCGRPAAPLAECDRRGAARRCKWFIYEMHILETLCGV